LLGKHLSGVLMTLLQQNEKVSRIARLQARLDGGCDWLPDTENSGFWFVRTSDDANATEVPSATMSFVVEAFRRGKPTDFNNCEKRFKSREASTGWI